MHVQKLIMTERNTMFISNWVHLKILKYEKFFSCWIWKLPVNIKLYKINDPQEWWWFRQSVNLQPLWWWLPCYINAKIFISKHDAESMTDRKTSCCNAIILDAVFYALKKENQISQKQIFIYTYVIFNTRNSCIITTHWFRKIKLFIIIGFKTHKFEITK